MKILLVSIILAGSLLTLILLLDINLGISFTNLLLKLKKPYEVPEASEYLIIISFTAFFFIKVIIDFLKKKKGNDPSTN